MNDLGLSELLLEVTCQVRPDSPASESPRFNILKISAIDFENLRPVPQAILQASIEHRQ